jgi:hypothetical protein
MFSIMSDPLRLSRPGLNQTKHIRDKFRFDNVTTLAMLDCLWWRYRFTVATSERFNADAKAFGGVFEGNELWNI